MEQNSRSATPNLFLLSILNSISFMGNTLLVPVIALYAATLNVGAGTIGFIWPNLRGGFGAPIDIGTFDDIKLLNASLPIDEGFPAYFPDARAFVALIDPGRQQFFPGTDTTGDGTALNVQQEHRDRRTSLIGRHRFADFLSTEAREALAAGRGLAVADVAADPRTAAQAERFLRFDGQFVHAKHLIPPIP